jgi:hypothetical protein
MCNFKIVYIALLLINNLKIKFVFKESKEVRKTKNVLPSILGQNISHTHTLVPIKKIH